MGNPSDGYFGKTIACEARNFEAQVTLWESPTLMIFPHPVHDPSEFPSLAALHETARRDGYYGGRRLLFATCKKFWEYCLIHQIDLPDKNFSIQYETNIPRQVGLAGSSAIITAALKALMEFYDVGEEAIPKPFQPNLILSVETEELGISAGLQDRVVQVYGGLVYMDFDREYMEKNGHGRYEPMDPALLPNLFLAFMSDPSDSGKIHSDVRFRWQQGDPEVVEAMKTWAAYTDQARAALERRDYATLGRLMNQNFDLRRKIFGDPVLGEKNLRMIEIGRRHGAPTKFSGSGGAVIGLYESAEHLEELRQAYTREGFQFCRLLAGPDREA
jgi:glucuronokinase